MSDHHKFFGDILTAELNIPVTIKSSSYKSGGCINNAMKVETSEGPFFIKWQKGIPSDMFEKEAKGLQLLSRANAIKIPAIIGYGKLGGFDYLVLEDIESTGARSDYWSDYGEKMASMHKQNSQESFGLDHDNYIGKLPQPNDYKGSWIEFFIENRLEFQLNLALQNGMVSPTFAERYRRFYQMLEDFLPDEPPALLHGDMWSGNVMVGADGYVCLIDPAVYYGHREIELAFTRMFGGFDRQFYHSYQEAYPLLPGYEERVDIYNIYPHMVHVNLFGTSYLHGVESVLRRYL